MGCTDRQTTRKHNSSDTLDENRGIKKSLTFFGISSLGRGLDSESRSFFPSLVELPGGWELIPFTISGMGETNGNSRLLLELESFLSLELGFLSFCSLLALLDLAWWLLILWLEYVSVTRPLAWRTVLESEFVVALPLLAEFDEGRELLGLGRSCWQWWWAVRFRGLTTTGCSRLCITSITTPTRRWWLCSATWGTVLWSLWCAVLVPVMWRRSMCFVCWWRWRWSRWWWWWCWCRWGRSRLALRTLGGRSTSWHLLGLVRALLQCRISRGILHLTRGPTTAWGLSLICLGHSQLPIDYWEVADVLALSRQRCLGLVLDAM